MLISSISCSVANAMEVLIAVSWMTSKSCSLFFSLNFLESLSPSICTPTGKRTAAANTGPAKGPRPASSMPHTCTNPRWRAADSCANQSICSIRTSFSRRGRGCLQRNTPHLCAAEFIQHRNGGALCVNLAAGNQHSALFSDPFQNLISF